MHIQIRTIRFVQNLVSHNIRKQAILFLLFLVFVLALAGSGVLAQDLRTAPAGPQDIPALLVVIDKVTNAVSAILMAVVVIFILYAAFLFVSGGGNPEQVSRARQMLIYAVIGIVLALIAKGVPDILENVLL